MTPRERCEIALLEIVAAFQRKDVDGTLNGISDGPAALPLKALAAGAIQVVGVDPDYRVTDVRIDLINDSSRADMRFRVNGTIRLRGESFGRQPTMFRGLWQIEAGEWKLTEIHELDPISAEPLDRFHLLPRG